ncbi:MAG: RagB/SusD family nutrient uptake outer membrane protein [Tannerellaceae bacterium]|nr:RagB/SusD family nutrient uptake outer membrane protein [Tannerellaceae bacterium]
MKQIIKNIIIACSVVFLAGCSLDEDPYGFYSEDNFYKTAADAEAAVNYAYAALTYLEYSRALFFLGDMPTEILTTKGDASTDNQALDRWRVDNFDTNGTLTNFFKYSYIAINRANAVIKKVPNCDFDERLKNQLLGEAYFLRAFNYFSLVRNFGLVPVHASVVETLEQTSTPLAGNIDEIYNLIISDCRQAEELMGANGSPVLGRVDQVAAQSLLAKSYVYAASAKENNVPLYKDIQRDVAMMYDSAAYFADKVVFEQTVYGLEENLLDIYDVEKPEGKEHIFMMSMHRTGVEEGQYSKISKMFLPYIDGATIYLKQGDTNEYIASHDGWGEYQTEVKFYNSYDPADRRKTWLIADRIYNANGDLNGEWNENGTKDFEYPFCSKYIDPQFEGDKTSTRPLLIRFSDIALVYAEASGPTAKAYGVVNKIRNRAGLGDLPAGLSLQDFRERVLEERKFEMAFEGDYLYDLRRQNRVGQIQEVKDAGLTESQYTFYPIPQTEINLNGSYDNLILRNL